MKYNHDYFPYSTFCLRLPAFPIDRLNELNERISKANLTDKNEVLQLIEYLFSFEVFREAIFTSSMELFMRFEKNKNEGNWEIDTLQRYLISFYKYFSRMSHRSTPYGLFAGVSAGEITDQSTSFQFDKKPQSVIFQFNIQVVSELLRRLNNDRSFVTDEKIIYRVNNSLYTIRDKAYYVEKTDGANGYQISNLTSVTLNEHLTKIIHRSQKGASFSQLVDSIELPGAAEEQKVSYIHSLIQAQILVNDFWPSVSGHDFMQTFLDKTAAAGISHAGIEELKSIHQLFKQAATVHGVKSIRDTFQTNQFEISKQHDFYRLDMFHRLEYNAINKKVVDTIQRISYELMMISSTDSPSQLETFKRNFFTKYENQEIPLVIALDPNFGIGYGLAVNGIAEYTPLVDGIPIEPAPDNRISFNRRMEQLRQNAKKSYFKDQNTVYKIDDEVAQWLKHIRENDGEFKNRRMTSVYCFGSISAESVDALDNGQFLFRPTQIHAPYACRLLSRFTHGQDELFQLVRTIAEDEQKANPQAILAEVVYIPDGKYANISLTGQFRQFEITYSSTSNLSEKHQLNVNDLMVSLNNGRVVLRSKSLNKEIIPMVSNTYDASFANPIYQFFSDMNYQQVNQGFYWNWSYTDNDEPFLPRIEYKQFVLSRARWMLKQTKIDYTNFKALNTHFATLKKELRLPRYVVIPEGDNELLIDLENSVCQSILAKELTRKNVVLYEFLNTRENCFVSDESVKYCNEVIFPLGTSKPFDGSTTPVLFEVPDKTVQRTFAPGTEWMYFKIFAGTKLLEDLVPQTIQPYCEELLGKGIIDQWFFIRYDESGYHIRLRLHRAKQTTDEEWLKMIPSLNKRLQHINQEDQFIRWTIDTYQREIERYGAAYIELSERIFYADSKAVAQFLDLISGNDGEEYRWKFALVSIDSLLNDFGYDIQEKVLIMGDLSVNFFREFIQHSSDKGKMVSKILRSRYRENAQAIKYMLQNGYADPDLEEGYLCFRERSKFIKNELLQFGEIKPEKKYHLLYSFIHMLMNRLFIVNQRKHELVIYHYLNNYYESTLAQQKIQANEYTFNQ